MFVRGDGIRPAVQVNAVLAERLTMVRDVNQEGVVLSLPLAQCFDEPVQDVVRIGNRVVVGVQDLPMGAVAEVDGVAGGLEPLELRRVAAGVRWTVAALLVEDPIPRRSRSDVDGAAGIP